MRERERMLHCCGKIRILRSSGKNDIYSFLSSRTATQAYTVVSKRSIADAAVGTKRVATKEIYILSFTKEKEAIANGRTGTDQQLIFTITNELIMLKKYSLHPWVVNDCQ